MSTLVKITGKNTGKDVSVVITDSQGKQYQAAQLGILTHFEVKPNYTLNKTKSIINNGAEFNESIPHGLQVILKFVRYNSGLEDFEANYRQQSNNGTMLSYTVQYQVANRDGSVSSNSVVMCKPHDFNLGAYTADQDVTQSVTFDGTDETN